MNKFWKKWGFKRPLLYKGCWCLDMKSSCIKRDWYNRKNKHISNDKELFIAWLKFNGYYVWVRENLPNIIKCINDKDNSFYTKNNVWKLTYSYSILDSLCAVAYGQQYREIYCRWTEFCHQNNI